MESNLTNYEFETLKVEGSGRLIEQGMGLAKFIQFKFSHTAKLEMTEISFLVCGWR
jgi:hypothetical protein